MECWQEQYLLAYIGLDSGNAQVPAGVSERLVAHHSGQESSSCEVMSISV